MSPLGTLEIPALDGAFHTGAALGTACRDPGLACRDESTLGVLAVTLNFEHTLVITQHIARLTEAALLAGRDFRAGSLTAAIRVKAGRLTGGKAVREVAVGRTLQSDFHTVAVAIIIVLAVSLRGTLEILALDSPSCAGTALGAASRSPGLACGDKSALGVFAVTLNSGYTFVLIEHKARVAEAAFLAS